LTIFSKYGIVVFPHLLTAVSFVLTHAVGLVDLHCSLFRWADSASLNVIKALITDHDSKHVLFVCTHRLPEDCDDEFNDFVKDMSNPLNRGLQTEYLLIESLDHQGVNAWFSILLHSSDLEATKLFSQLTWKRTNGNPFFIERFVEHLHFKGILTYDIDHWTWDLSRAENETECSANVVGLVLERIATLPADTQLVLKLGAILGFSFDIDVLKEVALAELARCGEAATLSKVLLNDRFNTALATSLKTGLIEKGTGFAFKFTHNNGE
jgi:predicted ATPase